MSAVPEPRKSWEQRLARPLARTEDERRAQAERFRQLERDAFLASRRAQIAPPRHARASTGPGRDKPRRGRPGRPAWTPPDTLMAEYTSGLSVAALAEIHDVSADTIRRHLAAAGQELRDQRTPRAFDSALVDRVRAYAAAGHTQVEIAKHEGTTQKVIWRLMRRHGITPAQPWKGRGNRELS